MNHPDVSSTDWWKTGLIYHIYPRSFCSSYGGETGDVPGILSRLDYLEDLGVDAIWTSPFYPSPDVDFGYDISDYLGVDERMGTLSDVDDLISGLHGRGMRLIIDGVFNHCSAEHPWFKRALEGESRDYFIWRDGSRLNNWASAFGGRAWSNLGDEAYFHGFHPRQPDLNWRNPEVVDAVLRVMKTWYDRGVDGFRLDVFNSYIKDVEFRDNPWRRDLLGVIGRVLFPYIGQRHIYDRDRPELLPILKKMRLLCDEKDDRVLIGETLDERFRYEKAHEYCGPERLHLVFNFGLLHSRWGAGRFARSIEAWANSLGPQQWPTWVVSNHDFSRAASRWRFDAEDKKGKLVAMMLCSLRGVPFLYYGDELGMRDLSLSRRQILDPPGRRFWPFYKGRDRYRAPMSWTAQKDAGFGTDSPWLPFSADWRQRNVATQRADPNSLLNCWRTLIALKRKYSVLRWGEMFVSHQKGVLFIRRTLNTSVSLTALNMTRSVRRLHLDTVNGVFSPLFKTDPKARFQKRDLILPGLGGGVWLKERDGIY